jgi:hypothetical protein
VIFTSKALWSKLYYLNNKDRIRHNGMVFELKCLKSWEGFIPLETTCQICNRIIFFNKKNQNNSIHFDHKDDVKCTIKNKSPNQWLRKHKRNPKNEAIWNSCNFGMLCRVCNTHLPTRNRKSYILNVNKYVFGEGAMVE